MLIRDAVSRWTTPAVDGTYVGAPVSQRTRAHRESMARHIAESIGDADLFSLGPQHVWHIQQVLAAKSLSGVTINAVTHNVLRAMLRDFEPEGVVHPDVFVRIRRAKRVRTSRAPRCMSYNEEQRDRAIAALRGHWGYAIGATCFLTGCRIGEAAGLQWRDVDFEHRQITIARSRFGQELLDCKNEHSQRVVGMPDELAAILGALPRGGPGDFVLLGRRGGPFDVHTFRAQVWYPRIERAGLPRLVPHGARHTWATVALTNGVPLSQVAAHLGDTAKVVEKTYSHVLPRFDPNEAIGRRVSPPPAATVVEGRRLRLVK